MVLQFKASLLQFRIPGEIKSRATRFSDQEVKSRERFARSPCIYADRTVSQIKRHSNGAITIVFLQPDISGLPINSITISKEETCLKLN